MIKLTGIIMRSNGQTGRPASTNRTLGAKNNSDTKIPLIMVKTTTNIPMIKKL
jgi:hypothetical protein